MVTACVHTQVTRTGRLALVGGEEGFAPVLPGLPKGHEEVAQLTVQAQAIATPERLTRHLQRRASLLGCDGIIDVVIGHTQAQATCVRHRELQTETSTRTYVLEPSAALLNRAAGAGSEGELVLSVLEQSRQRQGDARAWPLRWFLANYPNSRFAHDVAALLVSVPEMASATAPASVRGAPLQ